MARPIPQQGDVSERWIAVDLLASRHIRYGCQPIGVVVQAIEDDRLDLTAAGITSYS